jgi:beta-galactosidase GanA
VNGLKRPGVLRLWSYLAVAHGAETDLSKYDIVVAPMLHRFGAGYA